MTCQMPTKDGTRLSEQFSKSEKSITVSVEINFCKIQWRMCCAYLVASRWSPSNVHWSFTSSFNRTLLAQTQTQPPVSNAVIITPPPVGGRGIVTIVFGRFLSLFLCQQHYKKTAGPICMKFSGTVWSDHGTTWLNFGSIRENGSAGQRSICSLSPAIAQRTGVNKSVSFAMWQQGVGFVVPRTTACYNCDSTTIRLRSDYDVSRAPVPFDAIRREQKKNVSTFRCSRIVVESQLWYSLNQHEGAENQLKQPGSTTALTTCTVCVDRHRYDVYDQRQLKNSKKFNVSEMV